MRTTPNVIDGQDTPGIQAGPTTQTAAPRALQAISARRQPAGTNPHGLSAVEPLRVVVLTPAVGGQGGIARMMDGIGEAAAERETGDVSVRLVGTRGSDGGMWPVVYFGALATIAWLCSTRRCDVLHVNLASFGSTYRKLLLAWIARITGTPYVLHLHGGQYQEFWDTRPRLVKRLLATLFLRAARIIVLGAVWKDFIAARVPDAASRIQVMPNATRRPPGAPSRERSADPLQILFLGKLSKEKGVPELLQALTSLRSDRAWRAVLAGDGDVETTRQAVLRAGLDDRIDVPGWVGPDDVAALWQRSDIFVLPSHIENLPLSIIEAFAHGVPVVSTPVGSVPEIVEDGDTGLIVPVGDARALADALSRLVADEALRLRLAEAGRTAFDAKFEMGGYLERMIALWKSAAR